jgi:dipeptidyl aminopeptidase/acylaminoacyl peptidase
MTTSHLTLRILVAAILAAIAVGVPVTAQRVSESELLLREALHKQQVQGDLPGAIKIYRQIVSATNTNRAVAARALLELAGCYEKLGQQAEAVYQRIVRDFGDQPVAVQARARLAALRPAALAPAMTLRKLEVVGEDIVDIVHTDGERAVFLAGEPEGGLSLEFGDLSGKARRIVGPRARLWSVSPDLSTVATYQPQTRQSSITIMKTDGSGERILELRENGAPLATSGRGPLSMDWSWDNRYLVITNPHETGSRLLRVTVADGTVTEVQPGLRGAAQAKSSPDGQFIVYDSLGRIYVLPSGGGESQLIATGSGFLVGWTRDGRHVLIRERTTDGWLLSAVPVQHGRRQGAAIALRSVPGSTIRTMMNGSLFVTTGDRPQTVRDTWLGTLDDGAASVTWTPLNLAASPLPQTLTPWSADGTRFAYVTGNDSQAMRVIRVKNISTGDDRELYRADYITGCVAAHREDVLYCTRVAGEELHVVSVSLESGRAVPRGTLRRGLVIEHVTTDDRKIVFLDLGTSSRVEWEIATGAQRAVPFYRSEDGRWSLSGGDQLRIRPATDGGDWRFLVLRNFGLRGTQHIGVSNGGAISLVRFSPNGNWVVYHDRDAAGKNGFYRIAADGGEPQRLGDYPATALQTSSLSVSPDGRRFLVSAARPPWRPADFWILENFLPAVPATSAGTAKTGK